MDLAYGEEEGGKEEGGEEVVVGQREEKEAAETRRTRGIFLCRHFRQQIGRCCHSTIIMKQVRPVGV